MNKALWAIAAIMAMVVAVGIVLKIERERGAKEALAAQEKANARFQVNQNKGAVSYDLCDRADGLYDFVKGTCKLP